MNSPLANKREKRVDSGQQNKLPVTEATLLATSHSFSASTKERAPSRKKRPSQQCQPPKATRLEHDCVDDMSLQTPKVVPCVTETRTWPPDDITHSSEDEGSPTTTVMSYKEHADMTQPHHSMVDGLKDGGFEEENREEASTTKASLESLPMTSKHENSLMTHDNHKTEDSQANPQGLTPSLRKSRMGRAASHNKINEAIVHHPRQHPILSQEESVVTPKRGNKGHRHSDACMEKPLVPEVVSEDAHGPNDDLAETSSKCQPKKSHVPMTTAPKAHLKVPVSTKKTAHVVLWDTDMSAGENVTTEEGFSPSPKQSWGAPKGRISTTETMPFLREALSSHRRQRAARILEWVADEDELRRVVSSINSMVSLEKDETEKEGEQEEEAGVGEDATSSRTLEESSHYSYSTDDWQSEVISRDESLGSRTGDLTSFGGYSRDTGYAADEETIHSDMGLLSLSLAEAMIEAEAMIDIKNVQFGCPLFSCLHKE